MASSIKRDFLRRSETAFIPLLLFAAVIIYRLVVIQHFEVYQGKFWHERVEAIKLRRDTIPAMRGNIFATDGSLLSTSLPTYEAGIDPRVAKDKYFAAKIDSLGLILGRLFPERTVAEHIARIRQARANGSKYVLASRRRIDFRERQELIKWPFFRSSRKLSARGGALRTYYERYHPFAPMANRTLGELNPATGRGQMGLEASFDRQLSGKPAIGLVEVLSGGVRRPVSDEENVKPEPGLDLYTTIDVNYQDMAETALRRALTDYQADRGCVVVMEVATGEIRAIANLTRTQRDGQISYDERLNHALAGLNDPGSTFKLASMMALLEEKAISPSTVVDVGNGVYNYRGFRIEDANADKGGYGPLTARQVFEKSSNVGVHLLMRKRFYGKGGPDLYCQYLRRFHLTQPTGIRMLGEGKPDVHNPDSKAWSKWSLAAMAHGYEMSIAPLQMLAFYNAVANDGRWVRPLIVKQIKLANEVVEENQPYVDPQPICSPPTIKKLKQMLEGVVEHGTATNIRNDHYRIAGKTGTAQKIINRQYAKGHYYTSFIGYFPANRPRYSCLVMIDHPRGQVANLLMAGSVSAPVFKAVADRIVAYDIGMHPPVAAAAPTRRTPALLVGHSEDLRTIGSTLNLNVEPTDDGYVRGSGNRWQPQSTQRDRTPDVRGLPLRDALPLLESRGYRVLVAGAGKVREQSILPGTAASAGQMITLRLE